jgi:thymidine kinase
MAKLYFRYGTMGSAKTLNLLATAHSYRTQDKKVCLAKPALDTRFGNRVVRSRSGLELEADVLIDQKTRFSYEQLKNLHCILIDEAQFLSADFVDHLREVASFHDVPVICYGLRGDFRTHLFEGSKRLLELADQIEEIKSTCQDCNKKAVFNLRLQNGKPTREGSEIQLGGDETYVPVCHSCYARRLDMDLTKGTDRTTERTL